MGAGTRNAEHVSFPPPVSFPCQLEPHSGMDPSRVVCRRAFSLGIILAVNHRRFVSRSLRLSHGLQHDVPPSSSRESCSHKDLAGRRRRLSPRQIPGLMCECENAAGSIWGDCPFRQIGARMCPFCTTICCPARGPSRSFTPAHALRTAYPPRHVSRHSSSSSHPPLRLEQENVTWRAGPRD